jgi:glycoside/pentoside/hexuronide:cation symporter, GPH family
MEPSLSVEKPVVSSQKLPLRTKFLYGLGDWGNTTTSTIFQFFFSFFLTDIARLSPLWAAPVLIIGGIWDAINDPIVGVMVDRTRTRWGRRRPYFLFCAIPFSIVFIMLWWVPPWDNQMLRAAYYMVAYILFDTVFTLLTVPYGALTPELTEDYNERTTLTGFRMGTSMAGGLIAAISVPMIIGMFHEAKTGYLVMALIFGGLAGLPYFMLFFNMRERHSDAPPPSFNLVESFLHTLRNRAFRYVAMVYMMAWITVNLVAALFEYYVTYWMHMADQFNILLGLVQLSALICIPIIVWLSGRHGKQKAYVSGMVWWAAVMLGLAFLPPSARTLAYVLGGLTGLGIAAAHVIPWSMIPDVIEEDEYETGERREGAFYGFLVFIQKTGTAFVLAMVQLVLHWTGYQPGVEQSPNTLLAIRLLFGALPGVLLAISMFFAWRYPINQARHMELREKLAVRRAEQGS